MSGAFGAPRVDPMTYEMHRTAKRFRGRDEVADHTPARPARAPRCCLATRPVAATGVKLGGHPEQAASE